MVSWTGWTGPRSFVLRSLSGPDGDGVGFGESRGGGEDETVDPVAVGRDNDGGETGFRILYICGAGEGRDWDDLGRVWGLGGGWDRSRKLRSQEGRRAPLGRPVTRGFRVRKVSDPAPVGERSSSDLPER